MEETANKSQFCADFNSSMRLTVC